MKEETKQFKIKRDTQITHSCPDLSEILSKLVLTTLTKGFIFFPLS